MFLGYMRKFLFKCDKCEVILSIEFERITVIDQIQNDKLAIECPCGGTCLPLRD